LAHCYSSVTELKEHLVDGGTGYGTTNDDELLQILESASRTIDLFCNRSRFGSGFGPRTGTNRYDSAYGTEVEFDDDLLSLTSLSLLDSTAGTSLGSPVVDTDYYLWPYDSTPKRRFVLHGQGSVTRLGSGRRVSSFTGSWGYQDERVTATPTIAEALDASETGVDVSAVTGLEVGQTWLADSEQLYVTGITGTTATVVRGANGTTAAAHNTGISFDIYRYPRDVARCAIALAARRRRMRDANSDGAHGGGEVPAFSYSASERAILRDYLRHYRYAAVA
jgi:hypothetical protein